MARQDDEFQTNPGDTNPMEEMKQRQKQTNDFEPPFSPPGGAQDRIDDTFPETDTNIDATQRYQEGIEGAAGVDMPGEAAEEDRDLPNAA